MDNKELWEKLVKMDQKEFIGELIIYLEVLLEKVGIVNAIGTIESWKNMTLSPRALVESAHSGELAALINLKKLGYEE